MLNGDSDTDFIYGNSGEDTLSSGDGNEFIFGGADDDCINSGGARDVLRGNMNNASTMAEADFVL